MKCPWLMKWVIYTCKAGDNRYSPSGFQLGEYCRSVRHRKCPFYLGLVRQDTQASWDRPHALLYQDA